MFNFFYTFCIILLSSLSLKAQVISSPILNNGEILLTSSNSYIYITNNSLVSITPSISIGSNSNGISLSLNRCSSILKSNQSCYIIVSFPNYSSNSQSISVPLKNGVSDLATLKFNPTVLVPQISSFNISSLTLNDFNAVSFIVQNKTSSVKSYSPVISGTDASKYSITLNRCSSIPANGTCQVFVKLAPQMAGSYSASISEPQVTGSISLSSTITSSTVGVIQPPNPSIALSTNILSFGTITNLGPTASQSLSILNNGNVAISPIISVTGTGWNISLNRCLVILSPGQSCSVSINFNAVSSMTNGLSTGFLLAKATSNSVELSSSLSITLNIPASLLTSNPASTGTLSLTSLSPNQNIYESDLFLDTDGKKKLLISGICTKNNQDITMILDEFPNETFSGIPKSSFFCDENWNCTSDASLVTQCTQGNYQFKVPLQELTDFWYYLPYGGQTHLKIQYTSVVSENVISLNFNNYSSIPFYYKPSDVNRTVDVINVRTVSDVNNIKYYAKEDVRLGTWMYGSRYNNPRNISVSLNDYPIGAVDSNNYPIEGEVKISLNNTCTGGTWQRGFSQEPNVVNYARHFFNLTFPLSLPVSGQVQEISIQGRDLVTGQYSACGVRKFAYSQCPNIPLLCDSGNFTVDFNNIYLY